VTDAQYAMVTEWMVNGNINEFLRAHTDVDRLELVRILFEAIPLHFPLTTA